jgi:hypothetical protein
MPLSIEPETNNTGKEEKGIMRKDRIGKIKGEAIEKIYDLAHLYASI